MPLRLIERALATRTTGASCTRVPAVPVARLRRLPRDLDVGVIYTGERDLMGPLLSTMKASAPGLNYRLILVDNHSHDGIEPWRQIIPETKVLKNSERLHYAANMNRIVAASTARYVLVMNTDMFFDPRQRCLSRMVEFMDSHPALRHCRLPPAARRRPRRPGRAPLPDVVGDPGAALRAGRLHAADLGALFLHGPRPGRVVRLPVAFRLLPHAPQRRRWRRSACSTRVSASISKTSTCACGWPGPGWQVMYHGATSAYHIEQRASRKLFSADAWKHLRSYLYWLSKWGYRATAETPVALLAAESGVRRGRIPRETPS